MAKKNETKEVKCCPFCGHRKVIVERKETYVEDYSIDQNGAMLVSRRYLTMQAPPKKKVAYCAKCGEFAGHIIYDQETDKYKFSKRKVRNNNG